MDQATSHVHNFTSNSAPLELWVLLLSQCVERNGSVVDDFDVRPACLFNINSCGFLDGNIKKSQPCFVKRFAPQTMDIGRYPLDPIARECGIVATF